MQAQALAGHLTAHARALRSAEKLLNAPEGWAAVCCFYAAYSAVRHALCADQRLNGDAAARAVDPRLTAGSRHVEHHNGHKSRGPGVNHVVRYLYPAIGSKYEFLHMKSCEVRYQNGLIGSLEDVQSVYIDVIAELQKRGFFPEE